VVNVIILLLRVGDKVELIIIFGVIIFLIFYIKITSDKHKFKKINFKNKKLYLCVFFLYGNCNLKTNKAVISRDGDLFLIETEDKNLNIESFSFNKGDVQNIEIRENLSSKSGWNRWNNFTSPDAIGIHSTYTMTQTTKYYQVYDIKIHLKNDIRMHIQSTKSPYFIFD